MLGLLTSHQQHLGANPRSLQDYEWPNILMKYFYQKSSLLLNKYLSAILSLYL